VEIVPNKLTTSQQVRANTHQVVIGDTEGMVRIHLETVSLSAQETRNQSIREGR
jgi:hypothetical protein